MGLHSVFKGLCSLLVGHILWHCLHICQEKGQKHCKSDSTEEFDIFFCNLEMLFRSLLIAIYKMCWKLKEQGWTPAYVSSQHKKIFFTDLKHLIYTRGKLPSLNSRQQWWNSAVVHTEKSNKMQQCIKIYCSIFIWSSTCFRRHTARHQEPKTALAASGFAYMEGCWTCGCWTL